MSKITIISFKNVFRLLIKVLWTISCVFLAVFGLSQSYEGSPEGGIASAIALIFLTMPLGSIAILGLPSLASLLWVPNISYLGSIVIYATMIGLGYWQWFVLLPKLVRRMKHERSPKVWGVVFFGLIAILYGLYRFYNHAFPNS